MGLKVTAIKACVASMSRHTLPAAARPATSSVKHFCNDPAGELKQTSFEFVVGAARWVGVACELLGIVGLPFGLGAPMVSLVFEQWQSMGISNQPPAWLPWLAKLLAYADLVVCGSTAPFMDTFDTSAYATAYSLIALAPWQASDKSNGAWVIHDVRPVEPDQYIGYCVGLEALLDTIGMEFREEPIQKPVFLRDQLEAELKVASRLE